MLMELKIIILSEVRQTEKDKCHITSFICRILKKIMQVNLCTTQKWIHRHRKQTYVMSVIQGRIN